LIGSSLRYHPDKHGLVEDSEDAQEWKKRAAIVTSMANELYGLAKSDF
jgi:hypothetical protein